jgi:hypothetical protein
MPPLEKPGYMHLSIDDVIEILRELDQHGYKSVFEHPIFHMFEQLHQQYGAVFSLYCFFETIDGRWNLNQMSSRFKEEFRSASRWLRFGFHGFCYETKYGNHSNGLCGKHAHKHYGLVTEAISHFADSSCIDTIPRVHYYQGTIDNVRSWRDGKNGIKGLLSADDSRDEVYYLNQAQREALLKCDDYFDYVERLYFIHTDVRLENVTNVIQALDNRLHLPEYVGQQNIQCIFTHEDQLIDDEIKRKLDDCCQWASLHGYPFLFPMDTISDCYEKEAAPCQYTPK